MEKSKNRKKLTLFKWIAIVLLCAAVLIAIILLSQERYENTQFISDGTEAYLLYKGEPYFSAPIFTVSGNDFWQKVIREELPLIGWYFSFPFHTNYYAVTTENPTYIICEHGVYAKEGYSYVSAEFFMDGLAEPFVFSDAVTSPCPEYDSLASSYYTTETKVRMWPKMHEFFSINATLSHCNGNWYLVLPKDEAYLISPSFLETLEENGLLGS